MLDVSAELRDANLKLGLIPTMGFLHDGHLSLVKLLDGNCDVKAASIFVNPTQFGKGEDYSRYPRNEAQDFQMLERAGVDIVFSPEPADIYKPEFQTFVEVEELQKPLCGSFRPGHFRGVATVVLKLFNITGCSTAAFGLKDFQQAAIIHRMVEDLNLPVKLLFGEILRESDGLAMSSRNVYLSPEERADASALSRSLKLAETAFDKGERRTGVLENIIKEELIRHVGISIQYIEIVESETLTKKDRIERSSRALIAAFIGKTRLIDNIELKP